MKTIIKALTMNFTNTILYFYTTIQPFDLQLIFTLYINTLNPPAFSKNNLF